MVDVRLITLLPPAPPVTGSAATAAVTTQGGAPIVPQLPAGSILSGFIINRDAGGNPILRTDTGDVTFSSNYFLKIGSEVVIRIQNNAGHTNAHIVTVNGLPPEVAETQSSFNDGNEILVGRQQPLARGDAQPQQTQAQNTQQTQPAQPSPLAPGKTISAIIITPPPATPGAPAAQAPLPPGTSLLLDVLSGKQLQQPPNTSNTALAQLTPEAPSTPGAQQNSALSSLLPQSPAPQNNTQPSPLTEIFKNAPPQQPAAQTTSAPPAPQQPAPGAQAPQAAAPNIPTSSSSTVIGQATPYVLSNQQAADAKLPGPLGQTVLLSVLQTNEDGSTTFESPLGTLRAANLGHVPQGQQFALRVTSLAVPNSYTIALANEAPPAPLDTLTQLSRAWPSMQQIASVLGDDAAKIIPTFTAAQATVAVGNPENIPQTGSQILFFLAALKGGSFREWLGTQNIRQLEEKGYGSLVKKAEGEFMQLARQFADVQPGNWQSAYFPIIVAGELQQVRAFFKREKKKNEHGQPTGDEDTRFVLEMDLSQLGEMQLDGLVKRRETNMQFDLVVRNIRPLSKEMEKDIQGIYTATGELTGYRGQILFQAVQAFPVHPIYDTTPHAQGDVIV